MHYFPDMNCFMIFSPTLLSNFSTLQVSNKTVYYYHFYSVRGKTATTSVSQCDKIVKSRLILKEFAGNNALI